MTTKPWVSNLEGRICLIALLVEQHWRVSKQFFQKPVAVVHKAPHNLHRGSVFILDLMKLFPIERKDLRLRVTEQNWRVGGNDELRISVLPQNIVE